MLAFDIMDGGGRSNLQPPFVRDYPPARDNLSPPLTCSSDNRRGAPNFLPSALAFSKPALVRRRMDTSSWSDTQGRSRPEYSPRTIPASQGRHPGTGPRTVRYRPGCESWLRAVTGRGCCPWYPVSAARWTPQPGCRPGPAGSPECASPSGCWYRRFRRRRHPDRCEKAPRRQPSTAGVGFPGRCPTARRLWGRLVRT